mgnify:CR=1 FL=1
MEMGCNFGEMFLTTSGRSILIKMDVEDNGRGGKLNDRSVRYLCTINEHMNIYEYAEKCNKMQNVSTGLQKCVCEVILMFFF